MFIVNQSVAFNIKSVNFASRFVPKCSCLVKAVVFKMSMPKNVALKLVIGVIRKPLFLSHAWIESEDEIVFGKISNIENYVPIFEIS